MRLDPNENIKLGEQKSIVPNSTLTLPKTIAKLSTKSHVDEKFNDPSIIKSTAHFDFNAKILDKVRFVEGNSMPAVGEHLTAKFYVDNAVGEPSLLRLDPYEKLDLDEQDIIVPNSTLT